MMSENITDAEWLRSAGSVEPSYRRDKLRAIAARLERLERENAELKGKLAQCASWNAELDIRLKAATQPALGPNPAVAEIVRDYLKPNGYGGCYSVSTPKCSCDGNCRGNSACRAGYIQPDGSVGPKPAEQEIFQAGFRAGLRENNGSMGPEKGE